MTEPELSLPKHSIFYEQYFNSLSSEIKRIYEIAAKAREQGFDPTTRVEIPPAHDVAARVEATLEGPVGVAKRIRELQDAKKSREEVAFAVAKEIAEGTLSNVSETVTLIVSRNPRYAPSQIMSMIDKKREELGPSVNNGFASMIIAKEFGEKTAREVAEKAADKAVRVALSILTESITAAPLEGISKVRIEGSGNEQYLALYLAGPIRAAGGTEAAMTVLVADYVRQVLNLPAFVSTEEETERALEEVELYARMVHLQYPVHPELVKFAASKLPIMLTGEPTEEFEVSGSRDLDRIETNRVRGGSVLVLNDGVVGRAAKLAKIVNSANIPGWEWLDELTTKISKTASSEEEETPDMKLEPKSDYLADVIGGRPVFSHPSRIGGFRLRYGRSRNTGLAGVGVHPATMFVVEEFLAPGTHIRTERPGKGSIVAPVDTIEGPIVLLKDGTVKRVTDSEEARSLEGNIKRIIYLGDILVALGEFLENNHPLVPSGYCEEWWSHDLAHAMSKLSVAELTKRLGSKLSLEAVNLMVESPLTQIPGPEQAVHLSKKLKIPLHPYYLYRWSALSPKDALELRDWILATQPTKKEPSLNLPFSLEKKRHLETAGIPHSLSSNKKRIRLTDNPVVILAQLGKRDAKPKGTTTLELLNSVSPVELRDKVGFSIGARMGRPEKAEERKMRPPVQTLFPVGRAKGTERQIEKVAKSMEYQPTIDDSVEVDLNSSDPDDYLESLESEIPVELEMVFRICPQCGNETFESKCEKCGSHTTVSCSYENCRQPIDRNTGTCQYGHDNSKTRQYSVRLASLIDRVKLEVDEFEAHGVRGVLGLTSDYKIPEYLGKGILRAKHDVYCYRDGTARFDATDAPLTHFTPAEIGTPVSRLRELGYITDYQGDPLISENQVVELKVQDIVIPENCAMYLVRVGRFVDDCLEKIYGLDRFYRFGVQEDVVGQLVIGLAPHTSAGIIGRIIGFTNASVCYAHPYWHAAKRRNCDGDEDALILVLDALLNFSKDYLPKGRGGLMDAPLVLSVILNPTEVDDESHNMEVCKRYPARFYEMVADARHPREVENLVDIVASRLNTAAQYEGFGFTHSTTSIDLGPKNSRYKILGSMDEKLAAQLNLATLIDAVDAQNVAERVLSTHFFRDIRGNLRAFSTQKIQCQKCRRVYRRIPLSGMCEYCNSSLSLTVRQKNISKYLDVTRKIIEDHDLDQYQKERLKLITAALDSLFVSEQTVLTDFFES